MAMSNIERAAPGGVRDIRFASPPRTRLAFPRRRRLGIAGAFALAGLLAIVLGWIGVSGTRDIADQLAYIASGGVLGLFFLGVGAAILVSDFVMEFERGLAALDRKLELRLQPQEPSPLGHGGAPAPGHVDGGLVAVRGARRVHHADCVLVRGKAGVEGIGVEQARRQGLVACKVCGAAIEEEEVPTQGTSSPDSTAGSRPPAID